MNDVDDFSRLISKRLDGYGAEPVIEFAGSWYTGDDLAAVRNRIEGLLRAAGASDRHMVAVVVRNRVPHAAAILGFTGAGRSFSLVYAFQPPESMARDIERLRPGVLVADAEDWTQPVLDAARAVGSVGIVLGPGGTDVEYAPGLDAAGVGPFGEVPDEPAVHVLTSGTTGPPKRIPIKMRVLEHAAKSATMSRTGDDNSPSLLFWPFGGIGGVCSLIAVPYAGGRAVLLEKFSVPDFVDAVKRYRLRSIGGPPAVVRMLLSDGVEREDLASVEMFMGGAGPLEPELKEEFERRFGVPVLWSYGATEFAGGVLAWTPDLYRRHGGAKRASSGQPMPGVQVRVVDPQTGAEVLVGERGLLEARVGLLGPDWVRTNDIASADRDGFYYLHGRADGAINRGGFKVLPETIQSCLVEHPAVLEAGVVGVADPILGEVPFAAVEVATGSEAPTGEQLKEFVRERLPAHYVPVRVRVLDRLPRTPSLKVSIEAVKALAAAAPDAPA